MGCMNNNQHLKYCHFCTSDYIKGSIYIKNGKKSASALKCQERSLRNAEIACINRNARLAFSLKVQFHNW